MGKIIRLVILSIFSSTLLAIGSDWFQSVSGLPPSEDIPEEVLRTQIIIAARSPIDGKVVSAAEYSELQAQLQNSPPPKLNSNIRQNIFLLRLRQTFKQIFPFLKF